MNDMNCPECGDPWDGLYCNRCFHRLTPYGQIQELKRQLEKAQEEVEICDLDRAGTIEIAEEQRKRAEKAEHERDKARAACAMMRPLISCAGYPTQCGSTCPHESPCDRQAVLAGEDFEREEQA